MFTLCLVLVGFLAGPACAQPDPGDDPNEYDNQEIFTTPVISEFMASNGSKEPLEEGELLPNLIFRLRTLVEVRQRNNLCFCYYCG